jgi:hypothetical protein
MNETNSELIRYIRDDLQEVKRDVKSLRVQLNEYKFKMGYIAGGVSVLTTLAILILKGVFN